MSHFPGSKTTMKPVEKSLGRRLALFRTIIAVAPSSVIFERVTRQYAPNLCQSDADS